LRIASKDGAHGIARDSASALIRLVHDDGRVTGSFRLPLPTPADRHCTPREQLAAAWFLMMAEQQLGAIPQAGGLAERMLRHATSMPSPPLAVSMRFVFSTRVWSSSRLLPSLSWRSSIAAGRI